MWTWGASDWLLDLCGTCCLLSAPGTLLWTAAAGTKISDVAARASNSHFGIFWERKWLWEPQLGLSFSFHRFNCGKAAILLLRNAPHIAPCTGGSRPPGQTRSCTAQWGAGLWAWHLTHYQDILLPLQGCDQTKMCALTCICQDSCWCCHCVQTGEVQFMFLFCKEQSVRVTSFQTWFLPRFMAGPYLMPHAFQKYQLQEAGILWKNWMCNRVVQVNLFFPFLSFFVILYLPYTHN